MVTVTRIIAAGVGGQVGGAVGKRVGRLFGKRSSKIGKGMGELFGSHYAYNLPSKEEDMSRRLVPIFYTKENM